MVSCGAVRQLTVEVAAEYCLSPWVVDTPLERVFLFKGEVVARREGTPAPVVAGICGQWGRRRLLGRISRGLDAMAAVRLWYEGEAWQHAQLRGPRCREHLVDGALVPGVCPLFCPVAGRLAQEIGVPEGRWAPCHLPDSWRTLR